MLTELIVSSRKNEILAKMLEPFGLIDVTDGHGGNGYWFRFASTPRIKFEILPLDWSTVLFTMCVDGYREADRQVNARRQMTAEEIVNTMQDVVRSHSGSVRAVA